MFVLVMFGAGFAGLNEMRVAVICFLLALLCFVFSCRHTYQATIHKNNSRKMANGGSL